MSEGPGGARSVALSSGLLGSVAQPTAGALQLPCPRPPGPQTRGTCGAGSGSEEEGLGHQRPCPPGSRPSPTPHPRRTTIWAHRVRFLEERALPHWATFTIWNAGRQGRRLYRSLTAGSRRKVGAGPCTSPAQAPAPAHPHPAPPPIPAPPPSLIPTPPPSLPSRPHCPRCP